MDVSDGSSSARFPALLHARVTDDENLRAALLRIATAGRDLLANSVAASVTIIEQRRPITAASTDEVALALDHAQYDANDGPCLTAARTGQIIRLDEIAVDDRWPAFSGAAGAHGIDSSLSAPLTLGGGADGGLNVYGRVVAAFSDDEVELLVAFADQASVVVSNAQAYWTAFEATRNLTIALDSRAVIERAKGVLIGRDGLSDDEAFDWLRQRSQHTNRKLHDIAIDVVEEARAQGRER